MANNNFVYEKINSIVIDALNKGICPWHQPWVNKGNNGYISRSGHAYSYLNSILLMAQGKPCGEFITLKQANAEGGKIKKGAKSAIVTFYTRLVVEDMNGATEIDENGNEKPKTRVIPLLKYYHVFHIDDVEGLEAKHFGKDSGKVVEPIAAAEEVLQAYLNSEGAPTFAEGGDEAFYSPLRDHVQVPLRAQFKSAEEYYSTAFHESVHSTGHKSRLNRLTATYFGSEDYSEEELVAEIGAAAILNQCGIDSAKCYNNSIAYLQGWAKQLADKPKAFAVAAARAEKAANWVMGDRSQAQATDGNTKSTKGKKAA